MSLAQSIANLTQQAAALLALPTQLAAQFTAGRDALETLYNSRLSAQSVGIYVNGVSGSDLNKGATSPTAVRTIHRAIALIPPGGVGEIVLETDIILT
ncbi:MAG: hypothetical protein HC777_02900, partial [Hyphomonadaceae bacterium]|nr:hypothetical protein [Hyphomonadaceae bacterium]